MQISTYRYMDIPRVSGFSVETFRDSFSALSQPVILNRFADVIKWPLFTDWSFDRIAKEYGNIEVEPRINFPDPLKYDINLYILTEREFPQKRRMCLKDFIKIIKTTTVEQRPAYLQTGKASAHILSEMSGLMSSFNFSEILPTKDIGWDEKIKSNLYLGTRGTRSGFHQDSQDNYIVMGLGRKRVFLISPYYTRCVYPFPGIPEKSQIAPEKPDIKKFPKMQNAVILTAVVGPQEVLYIPRGWWHNLTAIEPALMVNCFYGDHISDQELEFMYSSMGIRYELDKKWNYVSSFARTSFNIILKRSPIDGLPVWETPGSAEALRVANATRQATCWVKRKLLRQKNVLPNLIPRPFYY